MITSERKTQDYVLSGVAGLGHVLGRHLNDSCNSHGWTLNGLEILDLTEHGADALSERIWEYVGETKMIGEKSAPN